jgi:uncharacterized membrane protein
MGRHMRTSIDRIRHAISFEMLGIALVTPLGMLAFHQSASDMGVVAVGSATIAMVWNYIYNLGFDHALQRLTGSTWKTPLLRIFHAILFEAGLLLALVPFVAWWLSVSWVEALLMDVALAGFYLVYAYAFNLAYDKLFPLPEWSKDQRQV